MNPEDYLRDIFAKIAEGHPINKVDALLPWQANLQADLTDTPYAYFSLKDGIESARLAANRWGPIASETLR